MYVYADMYVCMCVYVSTSRLAFINKVFVKTLSDSEEASNVLWPHFEGKQQLGYLVCKWDISFGILAWVG